MALLLHSKHIVAAFDALRNAEVEDAWSSAWRTWQTDFADCKLDSWPPSTHTALPSEPRPSEECMRRFPIVIMALRKACLKVAAFQPDLIEQVDGVDSMYNIWVHNFEVRNMVWEESAVITKCLRSVSKPIPEMIAELVALDIDKTALLPHILALSELRLPINAAVRLKDPGLELRIHSGDEVGDLEFWDSFAEGQLSKLLIKATIDPCIANEATSSWTSAPA